MTKCQPTMLNHFHTTGCKCPLCHTGKLFLTTNLYTILSDSEPQKKFSVATIRSSGNRKHISKKKGL